MDAIGGRVLVMIGSMMLALGVFLPILSLPLRGSIDLFDFPLPGIAVLVLAAAALLLSALDLSRHAIWPGLGSLAALGIGYVLVQQRIEETRDVGLDLRHPIQSIRGAAARAADLQFGWGVLGLGALMVLAGSIMAWRGRRAAATAEPLPGRNELRAGTGGMPPSPGQRAAGDWPSADRTPLAPPPVAPPPPHPD